MKKLIVTLIQVILGASLIAYLFYRMHNTGELDKFLGAVKLAITNWRFLAIGAGGFFFCILFCTFRWDILLKAQGIHLPFRLVFMLFFVGQFFSVFMPGATSGDIFKAYFVAAESKHNRTEAVASVFIDRIIGLIALILLTCIIMLIRLDFFMQYKETRLAMIFIGGAFVATSIGIAIVFGKNFIFSLISGKGTRKESKIWATVDRVYTSFSTCITGIPVLSKTIALSLVNHVSLVVCIFFLGKALELDLSFIACLTVFPIINAIAALPLTPGGIGTRETACVFLLGVYGISQSSAIALSLLLYASTLAWGLVGGVVYFYYILAGKGSKMNDTATA